MSGKVVKGGAFWLTNNSRDRQDARTCLPPRQFRLMPCSPVRTARSDRMPWAFRVRFSRRPARLLGLDLLRLRALPRAHGAGSRLVEIGAHGRLFARPRRLRRSSPFPVGRLIDLGYGRVVMTAGSIAAAGLLALWSQVERLSPLRADLDRARRLHERRPLRARLCRPDDAPRLSWCGAASPS